jgi:hypothetical protein
MYGSCINRNQEGRGLARTREAGENPVKEKPQTGNDRGFEGNSGEMAFYR